MRRRITKVKAISFLSLVPQGANHFPVLYKEASQENLELNLLSKAGEKFEEQGLVVALAYAPENRDTQGDIASAEVVKEMAYSFAKNGMNLDIRHNEKPVGRDKAHVAESFIVQKADPRFAGWKDLSGNPVESEGAWGVVIKVDDLELRKHYREGRWNGVSMGGRAEFAIEKTDEEKSMLTKEDVAKMLADERTAILKAFDERLAAKATGPVTKSEDVNLLDIRSVEKRIAAVKKAKLAETVNLDDLDALQAHLDFLKSEQAQESPEDRANRLAKENAALARENAKMKKASRQPATDSNDEIEADPFFTKEETDLADEARKMAQSINKARGL